MAFKNDPPRLSIIMPIIAERIKLINIGTSNDPTLSIVEAENPNTANTIIIPINIVIYNPILSFAID